VLAVRLWPFVFIGKPPLTLTEQKRAAWGGLPAKYHITQPVPHKQWRPVLRMKRRTACG